MKTTWMFLILLLAATLPTTLGCNDSTPPPPTATLACGSINPYAEYHIWEDVSPTVDEMRTLIVPSSLSPGVSQSLHIGNSYPFNGHGKGDATVVGTCSPTITGQSYSVASTISINTMIDVVAGWGTSGNNPGGEAYAQPQWVSNASLAPLRDGKKWSMTIALTTNFTPWAQNAGNLPQIPKPSGTCTVLVDGAAFGVGLNQSVPNSSLTTPVTSASPSISIQCPRYGMNERGASGGDQEYKATIVQSFAVSFSAT